LLSECADFYFGVRNGNGYDVYEATILEQCVSDYYFKNGDYEKMCRVGSITT